jgi:hypothetical protein
MKRGGLIGSLRKPEESTELVEYFICGVIARERLSLTSKSSDLTNVEEFGKS